MALYNITTLAGREKIKRAAAAAAAEGKNPRRSYYPQRIDKNRAIGWRYLSPGTPGHWAAISAGSPESLGTLADVPEERRYSEALKRANAIWSAHDLIAKGQNIEPGKITLRQALKAYCEDLAARPDGGKAKAGAARARFERIMVPYTTKDGRRWIDDRLGRISAAEWKAWREWLTALPVAGRSKSKGKPRSIGTTNRDLVPVRAALNLAARLNRVADQWTDELKRGKGEEGRGHEVYLDAAQRAKLSAAAAEVAPEVAPLAAIMLLVPIRPGALAALKVADYNPREHALWIEKDKVNGKRRVALPKLGPDGRAHPSVAMFAGLIASKLPTAPLIANQRGGHWKAPQWQREIKKAALAAELPQALTIYWLRHSRITDLVMRGVAPMAIAKMAGTSVGQIEKTYHHLIDDAARDALMAA